MEANGHAGYSAWGPPTGPYAQNYSYDQLGNMTWRNGWGAINSQYSYSPQFVNNKMTINPVTGSSMQYDASGNLVNDGQQTYTYDATGQQATASSTGLSQSYDGDGVRVKKTENGATLYYLRSSVLGGQIVAELNSAGAWWRGYVYMGGQLLATQQSTSVQWVHQDPVTKSQRLTDSAGNVVSWIDVDPWGGETGRSSNQALQPHRYTSYERDSNGGDEAMFRRYEGRWQRFAQPDPYEGSYDLADPQSFNRYVYTQNDPVNFVDPSGLDDDPNFGLGDPPPMGPSASVTVFFDRDVAIDLLDFFLESMNRFLDSMRGGGGDSGRGNVDGHELAHTLRNPTPYVDLDVLNACTEEIFGVTVAAFTPSQKGQNGSFTGYGRDYFSNRGDNAMINVQNDVKSHSSGQLRVISDATDAAQGKEPRGERDVVGFTNTSNPYTNYTANNAGRLSNDSLIIVKTQVHELGHSLFYITRTAKYVGEYGDILENCVAKAGGFKSG